MCLSNIYRASDRKLLMDNTAKIEVKDGVIILRDLFGRVLKINGSIASVDLENNEVILQTKEAAELS